MVSASGLQVRDNEGPGLVAIGGGVQLSCDGCSLRGNQLAGAVVYLGGALVLEGTEVTGTAQSSNLDGGVGVLAANSLGSTPPSVVVRDSTISDNRVAGVWLTGSGSYKLSGNRVSGTADVPPRSTTRCGDGVYAAGTGAWDGTSGLLLDGNTLADNQGAGLFLDNGWADLEGNTWSGNSPDLWAQGEACLTPREDYAEAPESEICPKHDRTPCDLLFSLIPDISDIDSARPPPLWSALSRKPPSP
jgi:parallel beta-helix repeat protein